MKKAIVILIVLAIFSSCAKKQDPVETVRNIENISEKIAYIERTLSDKLEQDQFDELSTILARAYSTLGNYDKMAKMVDVTIQRKKSDGRALNIIAWNLTEANIHLDKSIIAIETAIKWTRNLNEKDGPADLSPKAWRQRINWRLASYLDTYGYVLKTLNLLGRADAAYRESISLDAENPETLLSSAEVKITLAKFPDAFDLAVKAYILEMDSDAKEVAAIAFDKFKKTDEDFESYFEQRVMELKAEERERQVNYRLDIEAPDFRLKSAGGDFVRLSDFQGKILFLDFWATWCPPCKEELPIFQQMYEEFSGTGVEFVAISADKDTSLVIPFLEEYGYTFTVLYDGGIKKAYDVAGIPTVFIIDGEGIIRYKHVGYRPDAGEIWRAQIEALRELD